MFFGIETIFSMAETGVGVPETIFPAVEKMFWTIKTMVFLV